MPPQRRKKPPSEDPNAMQPMAPPQMLFPDSQGRYRSIAGVNPSPSMENAKPMQQAPQVGITPGSVARRLQSMGGEEAPQQPQIRRKKSLMDYFMELQ